MSIDRWMDTEIVVHIYNGMLLSFKKEHIWVSPNEVDEPRAYCTEWSKSERETQRLYIHACLWNVVRWYWWTCLQGSSGDTDRTDMWTQCVCVGGVTSERGMEMCTLRYDAGSSTQCSVKAERGGWGGRWEEGSRGRRHMCTCNWFMLMSGRNQYNIIKRISCNKNLEKYTK